MEKTPNIGKVVSQIFGVLKVASKLKQLIAAVVLVLGILVVLFVTGLIPGRRSQPEYHFSSQLTEALDIAELSTSEFIYNGIADVYSEDGQKVLYSVAYDSTVKVGIQMSDIQFEIDEAQKIVKPILPAVAIQSPVVDPASIDYIPRPRDVDLKVSMAACKENTRGEAEKSEKLFQIAEENMKSIIEALLYPVAEGAGYRIEW